MRILRNSGNGCPDAAAIICQPYRESEHILASMRNPDVCFHAPDTESLHRYIEILKKTIPNVELRGKDIK